VNPTPFQRKLFWAALTALSFVVLGAVITLIGGLVIQGISFLQPLLIPIAVAGILAYLLEPVVNWLEKRKLGRTWSVLAVFLAFVLVITGILLWIVPPIWNQGHNFAKDLPGYTQKAQNLVQSTVTEVQKFSNLPMFHKEPGEAAAADPLGNFLSARISEGVLWLQNQVPTAAVGFGKFLQRSVGGFFGVFGTLLSLILVPVFLFFFLKEGPAISSGWSNYLPLRASPLKSEIVSLLSEINSYLINFFRGQLLVSMIDGAITAVLLMFVGLEFALLIGLLVAVLGLIPYAGVLIAWIPAVIISAAQFGDWWHPVLVTIIFLGVNNLDGIVIAPKIVGESVGLHPLTVIISVLAWSLILGGLLGALLAVPLTATLKVVLKRYFWDKAPTPEATAKAPPG
jgi:predicted PurR-regulated permease PerM